MDPSGKCSEELVLARLACGILAKRLYGLLSVGLGVLEMPTARDFITPRERGITALAEVLGMATYWHAAREPGLGESAAWQRNADILRSNTSEFFRCFLHLAEWRGLSTEGVTQAGEELTHAFER